MKKILIAILIMCVLLTACQPRIGGCAGVAPENIEECCDSQAKYKPNCMGHWIIEEEEEECKFICEVD